MLKFPYGVCDFYKIITNNFFYIDRTNHIPLIENAGEQILFLRPRRFGKSLLLSTLENYYDVAKADEFDKLFGQLNIGQNPTTKHNQYFILNWDFSAIDPSGEPDEIRQRMHNHINGSLEQFISHYKDFLDYDIRLHPTDALRSLQSIFAAVKGTPYKIYLLIDEYDNFANEVMTAGQSASRERYEALIMGEGALKAIFKAVKSGTKGLGIDRIFITGVSPVVMSDISSGFNIAENIYLQQKFNDLCGFRESEILAALQDIAKSCDLSESQVEEALMMMRTFYNGYRFSSEKAELIYNSTNVLYFLKYFQEYCRYPRQLLDENLAMDRGKIAYVSQLPHGERVISQVLNEEEPLTVAELASRFGIREMLSVGNKDSIFMASLLYYFGVLTFGGEYSGRGELILRIPNLVVRKLYVERIQELLLPEFGVKDEAMRVVGRFYQSGNLQSLCEFVEGSVFGVFDNRDYRWANELTVKSVFLSLLFSDTFYLMDSEVSLGRGYGDLVMLVRPDMRRFDLLDFLFEFKYVSLKEVGLTASEVRKMSISELRDLDVVKDKLAESKSQLSQYRQILLSNYGKKLRLHSYGVVAVGYERLVGCEV